MDCGVLYGQETWLMGKRDPQDWRLLRCGYYSEGRRELDGTQDK